MHGWFALRLARRLAHLGRWAPSLLEAKQNKLYPSCFVQVRLCPSECVGSFSHPFIELGHSVPQCLLSYCQAVVGFDEELRCRNKTVHHMAQVQHATDISASHISASWAGCGATFIAIHTAA